MKVSDVAMQIGIGPHVVRYYSRLGLLKPRRNQANGYRVYGKDDVYRLQFVLRAKSAGFTLADVKLILRDADSGAAPCPRVRALIRKRAAEHSVRLAEANRLRRRMQAAIRTWDEIPDRLPDHRSLCVLIDAIAIGNPPETATTRSTFVRQRARR